MAKPKITRIKAGESNTAKAVEDEQAPITRKKVVIKDEKQEKAKEARQAERSEGKVFILFRPFVAFARYLRDAWRELCQVRWPSRKATWKMVLAVLVYTALFMGLILVLDLFFTWLFNLILGK